MNEDEGGVSHHDRRQRSRSREEGAGSAQEHGNAMDNPVRTAETGEGDDVAGKGKAPVREGRNEGGHLSEGIGVAEHPESPGNFPAGKVVPADTVSRPRSCASLKYSTEL